MYVKQGSDKWHSICKSVRVTGSTFLSALGLDTLSKQKQHYNCFVNGKEAPAFLNEVQEMLDHGKDFEKHGIATLVGAIMPALLPPCYMFFEVSTFILQTPSGRDIICVSPDGLLVCTLGQDCPYQEVFDHKRIAVEIKSPFPQRHVPQQPYYKMPQHHVPQCTAEMVALESKELWLVCCTHNSVSLIISNYEAHIWNTMMLITDDLYSPLKPPIPTRLHNLVKPLRECIKKFVMTHCRFVLEVPRLCGTYGEMKVSEYGSPYTVAPQLKKLHWTL